MADTFEPTPRCYKPSKPYSFTSEYEVATFKSDVEAYQRCISKFVEEQKAAQETHARAANQAIKEFNRFVDFELR